MVTQVTSFSRNGLSDWLIQRVSSLILLAYFLFIGVQIANGIDYTAWRELHDLTAMKVFYATRHWGLRVPCMDWLVDGVYGLPDRIHARAYR